MNPIQTMKINETNLTKSELKIMDFTLNHLELMATSPLLTAADLAGTSKSALLRFTQKIGYKGYSEFRFDLSNYLSQLNAEQPINLDSLSITTIYASTIKQLDYTLDRNQLDRFGQMIRESNKIKVFGVAETGMSADFFSRRLVANGYDSETITHLDLMSRKAVLSTRQDLHIVFSLSSNTEVIRELIKLSLKRHIPIVLITQNERTDLKSKVDCFLQLPYFDYNRQSHLLLDSQIIIHAFIGIFINSLVEPQK